MRGFFIIEYYGIFGGGGIKGIAYLGALEALAQRGFRIKAVGGTSIGAIVASLLAVGYQPFELIDLLKTIDFTAFMNHFTIKDFSKVVKEKGLYSMSDIEYYLTSLYQRKNKLYYYQVKSAEGYLLRVVTTSLDVKNLFNKKQIIIPDDLIRLGINADSFPIARSVIMSSTYPGYYKPHKIDNTLFMDGGVIEKITTNLFSDRVGLKIAFRLMKKVEVPFEKVDDVHIINIPTNKTKTFAFGLSNKEKAQLLKNGYQAAALWIKEYFLINSFL